MDVDEDSAIDDAPCDGDTDAEPSLGSFDRMSNQIKAWSDTTASSQFDVDCELDRCDDEPSLGSVNTHHNHTRWTEGTTDEREGDGCADDREEDNADKEDGADREPSFGWSDEEAARGRYPSLMGEHDREAGRPGSVS